jgi:outer membrane lipoprotein SlyB
MDQFGRKIFTWTTLSFGAAAILGLTIAGCTSAGNSRSMYEAERARRSSEATLNSVESMERITRMQETIRRNQERQRRDEEMNRW